MAPARRHRIGASRRRREDDGEEEGSVVGAMDEDSMSDGSLLSHQEDDDEDADEEGSDLSDVEGTASANTSKTNGHATGRKAHRRSGKGKLSVPVKPQLTTTVSDTEAMMNGLSISDRANDVAEIQFEDMGKEERNGLIRAPSAPPTESRRDTIADRKRREHEEYIKARDEDPSFVPTRGGFFLHDKRSTGPGSNGHRTPNSKAKSRPYGLIVDGNVGRRPKPDATDGQWTHDLHDTVAHNDRSGSMMAPPSHPSAVMPNGPIPVSVAPRSTPPNRSFSTTVLIGNVPVKIFLPGMAAPILLSAVPKRQHTRLPQHRPPLRRDKPVRISLPDATPKYTYPAPERSFIFIPRALRPNQQSYRGRGRGGGYYGGRRPSLYAGSVHSPSLSMSRRSSLRDGMQSPAGSVLSRQTLVSGETKPVVRLPPMARPPGPAHPAMPGMIGPGPAVAALPVFPQGPNATYRESRGGPIIMHQPRPQKTVSVADIETPASLHFNPPQPQQEQPFHHQVPVAVSGPGYGPDTGQYPHGRHPSHPSQASGTPLSQIPERAIHAQPFQPYGFASQQGYYGGYHPGSMYYPMPQAEYPAYNIQPGQTPAQPYVLAPPPAPPSTGEQAPQAATLAHEANGTVYFYDAAELYPGPSYPPGGVVGMGGMMTPPGTTYYYPQHPQHSQHPQQPSGGTIRRSESLTFASSFYSFFLFA
ncbi:CASC3/Barentsz eIF4AIII binding-domain-containing protein [Talaromyces proteolyticus]|uniref:CASC3/Barentsz eIF4AIII binding-domain-containing protein n=1 Tax=Talaromyces proteolyticus TaxID=1131652 RepID=A0AAD4PSG2_9EURO|nr:CASC3/Barentsz eIF4AIII binding-domain-containing protein [Talaromyces proteolyticus]KAH8688830.1 CASC3/Barentsz eIF4AIII binding-domain-containing protein [Talaromyces proteolyticus]